MVVSQYLNFLHWTGSVDGGKEERELAVTFRVRVLRLAQCHFCCVLLVKASCGQPRVKGKEVDPTLSWAVTQANPNPQRERPWQPGSVSAFWALTLDAPGCPGASLARGCLEGLREWRGWAASLLAFCPLFMALLRWVVENVIGRDLPVSGCVKGQGSRSVRSGVEDLPGKSARWGIVGGPAEGRPSGR